MSVFKNRSVAFIFFVISVCTIYACKKDSWDNHNAPVSQDLEKNLQQAIRDNADLSKFNELLSLSKFAGTLSQGRPFTVWAPSNKALESLDPAIIADTARLNKFIGYHIANQSYFTNSELRVIRTLSDKNISFGMKFEEASLLNSNRYVSNGVLHVINEAISPKLNAFEYANSLNLGAAQRGFIATLNHTEIDTSKGVALYTDPVTKKTVYQEGTTFPVQRNYYYQDVADLTNEDSTFTYVILTDEAFLAEKTKLEKYFMFPNPATSELLTKMAVVRDLVFDKVLTEDELTAQPLKSVGGASVSFKKADIVESRKLSNGIAYVVKGVDYPVLQNKIPSIVIQGEAIDSLRTPNQNRSLKLKKDPSGALFYDLQTTGLTSSPDPLYYYRYRTIVNSGTYKVYLRSVNDIYTTPISMKVDFSYDRKVGSTVTPLATTGYKSVAPLSSFSNPADAYQDIYMGDVKFDNYSVLYTFLMSATGVTSTTPTGLSIDYIKLVPVN